MHLSDLKRLPVTELVDMAIENEIENASRMRKQDLIFALLKNKAKKGDSIFGDGTLEVLQDGFGFLRSPDTSYLAGPDDIYVSPSQIRRFNLHTGTPSKVKSERRKRANAILPWSKLMKSTARPQKTPNTRFCLKTLPRFSQPSL